MDDKETTVYKRPNNVNISHNNYVAFQPLAVS